METGRKERQIRKDASKQGLFIPKQNQLLIDSARFFLSAQGEGVHIVHITYLDLSTKSIRSKQVYGFATLTILHTYKIHSILSLFPSAIMVRT